MLYCKCFVVVLTGLLCREEVKEFQKFKTCEKNMVFVALFMKNWYLKIVEAEHPVWALSETKQLYGHIVKEYKDCIPEKRPADTFNRPSKIFEKLYAHTWDFRWQYAVMTAINDFINVKRGREQESTKEKWIAYLEKAYKLSQTAVTPTAPVNAEPSVPGSGNGGPNPPGDGGGGQSDSATSGSDRPQSAPQSRKVKETKSAEDERLDRLRGAVTQSPSHLQA
jgi:hypothetical protein